MLSRLAPLALLLLVACSRSPQRVTTIELGEIRDAVNSSTQPTIGQVAVSKRPFPCCDVEQRVGFFEDYDWIVIVERPND